MGTSVSAACLSADGMRRSTPQHPKLRTLRLRNRTYFRATIACFAFASSGRAEFDPSQVLTSTA
jgi:hypothetical protein